MRKFLVNWPEMRLIVCPKSWAFGDRGKAALLAARAPPCDVQFEHIHQLQMRSAMLNNIMWGIIAKEQLHFVDECYFLTFVKSCVARCHVQH